MDPVTGAGLALAVLPLVVTVFEDYKAIVHLFLMLKHSQREARRFGESLEAQHAVFANECLHLLGSVTEEGSDMFNNPSHNLWQDSDLDKNLSAHLSNSLGSCISIIRSIKSILDEVRKETYGGFHELQKSKENGNISLQNRIIQKLKLAFSHKDFDAKIDMLRKYNGDLHVLRKQIENLKKHTVSIMPCNRVSAKNTKSHRIMRNASKTLYETLSQVWSCPQHLEHSPNICLDESPNRVTSEKVRFDVVFTFSRPLKSIAMDTMPVTIESMLEQSDMAADPDMLQNSASYKVVAGSQSRDRAEKTVSFSLPATVKPTIPESMPMDLCSVEDICIYVQNSLQTSVAASPIGYLQKSKTYKYFIFPPKTYKVPTGSVTSLSDTLLAGRTTRGMSLPEKLRLAKLLALAVLQFHSTPWLDENWRSEDILFFNLIESSPDYLGSPYLTARIKKKASEDAVREKAYRKDSTLKSCFPVPNVILFRLGVILLELGLEVPFADLQEAQEQKGNQSRELAEFSTAKHLAFSSAVSSKMGSRYARLVNRCLFCDFGLGGGYELDVIDLQDMFFQHVVLELDACFKLVSEL